MSLNTQCLRSRRPASGQGPSIEEHLLPAFDYTSRYGRQTARDHIRPIHGSGCDWQAWLQVTLCMALPMSSPSPMSFASSTAEIAIHTRPGKERCAPLRNTNDNVYFDLLYHMVV
jgi:hypothetical protein